MQGPIKGVPPRSSNCERLLKQNTWYFPLSREAPQKTNEVAVGDNHHNLLEGSSSIPLSSFSWIALPQSFRLLARHPNHPSKKKSGRTVFICILRCSDTFSISSRSMPKTVGLCLGLSLEPDNRTCYLDLPWSTSHNWLEKAWHGWLLLCILRPSAQQLNYTFCPGVGLLAHWIPTASETFCRITRANGKICNTYEYIWKQYITRNI